MPSHKPSHILALLILSASLNPSCGNPTYSGPTYVNPTQKKFDSSSAQATQTPVHLDYGFQIQGSTAIPTITPATLNTEYRSGNLIFSDSIKITLNAGNSGITINAAGPGPIFNYRCMSVSLSVMQNNFVVQTFTPFISTTGSDITNPADPCYLAKAKPFVTMTNMALDNRIPFKVSITPIQYDNCFSARYIPYPTRVNESGCDLNPILNIHQVSGVIGIDII